MRTSLFGLYRIAKWAWKKRDQDENFPQKRFLAYHRGWSFPSFLYIVKTSYCLICGFPYVRFKSYGLKHPFLIKAPKQTWFTKIGSCREFIKEENLYTADCSYLQRVSFVFFDTNGHCDFNSIFRDPWKLWYTKNNRKTWNKSKFQKARWRL